MTQPTTSPTTLDVLVVGGGAAGLSAATVLARSLRSVLVLDTGAPRNAPAAGVHGLIGHDGLPPGELLARGRAELASYGGRVVSAEAVGSSRDGDRFEVRSADGRTWSARHLVVATGARDVLPEVPGLREHWGRGVVHCPYCHGWEVRGSRVLLLATGPAALHQAGLFGQLTDRLSVLAHEPDALDTAARERLSVLGVPVLEGPALEVLGDGGVLTGVRTARGVVPADAVAVASVVEARPGVLADLGVRTAELEMAGSVVARHVEADAMGRTSVPRVWVAGNVADPMAQVVMAAAAGVRVGALVNAELVAEDQERRVAGS
ncbi:NAD(P)/FAD-dependent oxidoreductase [Phycicoccus endophyticus]|uniref:NAD(P)/FAD-dependent oxidoreductase n=1 Tax=Phycicoccus endophyticus TaxID=1690220 RepID=A0A7G9R4K4_9MICO|nr:NAD(P)/FAD-dependent oxidoreductase [Phycicoccus endophyticus]NHI18421.1 NAD(P)/FAD-dependent oxidoreductase [Phycicoccus endophyticus]QNN50529.1 NAD(P)/FAD-dependent oxidoreductase [Phycicoccus endophyticus]GGL23947.1 oxidoreductase [Phycicoccus endophyticus]